MKNRSFLEKLNVDNNGKYFNNLFVLKIDDEYLEDNPNENVQKKIDLQK